MPRRKRVALAGHVYHVLNRGAKKATLFDNPGDYLAFERLLIDARERQSMRILAYCLMPNHWHLLLWPRFDADLSRFVKWLTTTHAIRWNRVRGRIGAGAVYQSRFKSIPIERGPHLLWTWRYVERNALRAGLVTRAEAWRWSSLWRRTNYVDNFLDEGPLALPENWPELVDLPQTAGELAAFRTSMAKSLPYGSKNWLTPISRRRGRPALTKTVKIGSDPI